MIRTLGPGDEPTIDAFLSLHAPSSMFLRSNLRAGGIVDRGETYQGTWVGAFDGEALIAVICHGWNGMLLLQAPVRSTDLVDTAIRLSGRPVSGFSGPWPQVETFRAHLGLADRPTAVDGAEDLFALDLAALVIPEPVRSGRIRVRCATESDARWLVGWREAYDRELLPGMPESSYAPRAEQSIQDLTERGQMFVAEEDGAPVAISSFNATLPDTAQVGGVFTPPSGRSRGYARSVVAGSLAMARDRGTHRAILFTDPDNRGAQGAYRAIGFQVVGTYGVVLFR